jgi:hypothetical protein
VNIELSDDFADGVVVLVLILIYFNNENSPSRLNEYVGPVLEAATLDLFVKDRIGIPFLDIVSDLILGRVAPVTTTRCAFQSSLCNFKKFASPANPMCFGIIAD